MPIVDVESPTLYLNGVRTATSIIVLREGSWTRKTVYMYPLSRESIVGKHLEVKMGSLTVRTSSQQLTGGPYQSSEGLPLRWDNPCADRRMLVLECKTDGVEDCSVRGTLHYTGGDYEWLGIAIDAEERTGCLPCAFKEGVKK